MASHPPSLEELNRSYDKLSAEERDELLRCLFIAAPRGGAAVIKVLGELLLCHSAEELLCEHRETAP